MIKAEFRQSVIYDEPPRLLSYGLVPGLCTFVAMRRQSVASQCDLDNSRNGLVP